MSEIDWDKAPEGATHYVEGSICPFEKRDGDDWYYWKEKSSVWIKIYNVFGEERIKKTSMHMIARPSPAWSGEGLPPVGVVCEFQNGMGGWSEVEITAIAKLGVCFVQSGREGENYVSLTAKFRPIRTPEQIAEDEREAVVKQMAEDIKKIGTVSESWEHIFGKLYDCGYRKQDDR